VIYESVCVYVHNVCMCSCAYVCVCDISASAFQCIMCACDFMDSSELTPCDEFVELHKTNH